MDGFGVTHKYLKRQMPEQAITADLNHTQLSHIYKDHLHSTNEYVMLSEKRKKWTGDISFLLKSIW